MDDRSTEESASPTGISHGIMRIDGQAATSIKYARSREGEQDEFELTFRMGDAVVTKAKRLTPSELADAVGPKNAERMSGLDTVKGTLKGETLDFVDGVTPAERELRQAANTVEKVITPEHEARLVNIGEALEFAKNLRDRDRKLWAREKSQETADQAEERAERFAGASGQGKPAPTMDASASAEDREAQLPEHEQARRAELIDRLHNQYRVSGSRFHYRDQPDKIAFRDGQTQLKTATNDERVAQAMIAMADAKGWKTVKLNGHPDFMRSAWMEARLRGMETTGFKPQPADLEALGAAQEKLMGNRVDRVPERGQEPAQGDARRSGAKGPERAEKTAPGRTQGAAGERGGQGKAQAEKASPPPADGRLSAREVGLASGVAGKVLAHGPAHYNNDPQEKPSYFIKLATKDGERTVWGKELPEALDKGGAKTGDFIKLKHGGDKPVTVEANKRDEQGKVVGTQTIDTNRNTWSVERLDRAAAVLALGNALAEKHFKSPESQQQFRDAMERRVIASPETVPAVKVYDKAAPSREVGNERHGPVIERAPERTR
jgi:hypothetical protein